MKGTEAGLLASKSGAQSASADYGTGAHVVGGTLQDVKDVKDEFFSIREFWGDMRRRERTGFHQGTLILGILLALLVCAYCIVLEIYKPKTGNQVFRDYLAVELALAGLSQLFLSFRGICLENSPMLLMANVNAIGLTIRLGLSNHLGLLSLPADIVFLVLISVFTLSHLITSYVAWGGEFTRFIAFVIGTNTHIQTLYRQYQLLLATMLMDLQFLAMSSATIFFFTTNAWWHYLIIALTILKSFIVSSAVRRSVRLEASWGLYVCLPLFLISPIVLGFATFLFDFVNVSLPEECEKVAQFLYGCYLVMHVVCIACFLKCWKDWGQGLKKAFENQRTVRGYFAERKKMSLSTFLQKAKEPREIRVTSASDASEQHMDDEA
jgi:hypothetical protein